LPASSFGLHAHYQKSRKYNSTFRFCQARLPRISDARIEMLMDERHFRSRDPILRLDKRVLAIKGSVKVKGSVKGSVLGIKQLLKVKESQSGNPPSRPKTWPTRSLIAASAIRRRDPDKKLKLTTPPSKPAAKTIRTGFCLKWKGKK
jgi:hypothetical protein